jgi:putative ABC transport system permease protein
MTSSWRALASLAWRESRTTRRRLLYASSSITLGVAALVAIDSFAANVTRSVREQSRTLLGGDVAISARRAFSPEVDRMVDSLAESGFRIARETTFPAMAVLRRSGATRLVQVRAVSERYPLYGTITTTPAGRWQSLKSEAAAVVDPTLLVALDARVGDTISVGLAQFVLAAVVRDAPGLPELATVIGPRVFIPARYLPETQLLVFGSTGRHEALVRTPGGGADHLATALRARFRGTDVRVRTAEQVEEDLTEAVDQLRQFIGVVGMVALLLGGIGVASGVHAFVARKIDTVAVLRCVGATGSQVLTMYVTQAAVMGVAGAVLGAMLGVLVQVALPRLAQGFLPVDVAVRLEPSAILLGIAVGAWVALIFALRPLLRLRHISPLQTLRRDVDAQVLRGRRRDLGEIVVTLAIVASVLAVSFARATDATAAIAIALGTATAIGALLASGGGLSALARRLVRAHWPYTVRQGLSNLHRPGNQTRPVVLALGFGAFLVTVVQLVQANMLRRFDVAAAATGVNVVFFDVQDDQTGGLDSLLREDGQQVLQQVPVVQMRLAALGSRRVADLLADTARAGKPWRWALRWEYRSTYRDSLTTGERIVEGRWFSGPLHPDTAQISLEEDLANDLDVGVGNVITWDVQGTEIPARITSLRKVTWTRFEPNFFAVFRPGTLDTAPKQFVFTARTAGSSATERLQRTVVARYPNISSVDLSLVRRTVDTIVARVTTAVRFLAALSLLMGVPVILSAVAATRRDRIRESVLLKTLGATRATVIRILAAEYAALGILGSMTGVILAAAAAWALVHYVFKLPFALSLSAPLVIAAAMTALTVTIGMLAAREVFSRTPMDALREN